MGVVVDIARRLGAQRQGHNWRCGCPLCGYGLSLAIGEDDQLLAHCFGGCESYAILTALIPFGLLDDDDDTGDVEHQHRAPVSKRSADDDLKRTRKARQIYEGLPPTSGTLITPYLRSRAITLEVPANLRYGTCPHRNQRYYPAMAAPVVDINGGQTGVHLTFLRADRSAKIDLPKDLQRETRGVISGGVIRLMPYEPDRELIIGEGVESTLSAMEIFDLPGWSAVYAGGLKTLELPPTVQRIVIAADNDLAGQQSALTAYQRWAGEGRDVCIKCPPIAGDDFNNVLMRRSR
jgi:putative DNA primase/helicase